MSLKTDEPPTKRIKRNINEKDLNQDIKWKYIERDNLNLSLVDLFNKDESRYSTLPDK